MKIKYFFKLDDKEFTGEIYYFWDIDFKNTGSRISLKQYKALYYKVYFLYGILKKYH